MEVALQVEMQEIMVFCFLGRQEKMNIWYRNRSGRTRRLPTVEASGFLALATYWKC